MAATVSPRRPTEWVTSLVVVGCSAIDGAARSARRWSFRKRSIAPRAFISATLRALQTADKSCSSASATNRDKCGNGRTISKPDGVNNV